MQQGDLRGSILPHRVLQARCLVALWAELFSTWLVNNFLYPQFIGLFPEARDLTSAAGIVVLALLAFWAVRRPAILDEDKLTVVSLCVYGLGVVLLLLGLWEGSVPMLALGSCLRAVGSRWFLVLTGLALCRLSGRACMLCIAGAYALDYLLRVPFSLLGGSACLVMLFACPLISLLVIRPVAAKLVDYARTCQPPIETSVTDPRSFVPFGAALFVAIFLFRIAYGFALSFEAAEGVPQQTALSFIPILLVLALVWKPRLPKADVLYMASCLLIIAGFMVILAFHGLVNEPFAPFANGLLFVGSECFEMLVLFTLASIGARNVANAVSVFAWGRAASSAGLLCGVTVGHVIEGMGSTITETIVVGCVLFVFVAVNLTAFKGLRFQEVIDGVSPQGPLRVHGAVVVDAAAGAGGVSAAADGFGGREGAAREGAGASGAGAAVGTSAGATVGAGATAGEGAGCDASAGASLVAGQAAAAAAMSAAESAAAIDLLEQRAEGLAAKRGLTPRETEILALLAHGRNAAFLQEKLVLSRNTVKTHVANIYAKLGVHSQQELIDLVEAE